MNFNNSSADNQSFYLWVRLKFIWPYKLTFVKMILATHNIFTGLVWFHQHFFLLNIKQKNWYVSRSVGETPSLLYLEVHISIDRTRHKEMSVFSSFGFISDHHVLLILISLFTPADIIYELHSVTALKTAKIWMEFGHHYFCYGFICRLFFNWFMKDAQQETEAQLQRLKDSLQFERSREARAPQCRCFRGLKTLKIWREFGGTATNMAVKKVTSSNVQQTKSCFIPLFCSTKEKQSECVLHTIIPHINTSDKLIFAANHKLD